MKYLIAIGGLAALYVAVGIWIRRRPDPALHIEPLGPQHYRFTGTDEALRESTLQRRVTAEAMRRRAALVDSGEPVSDVIRILRRRA